MDHVNQPRLMYYKIVKKILKENSGKLFLDL